MSKINQKKVTMQDIADDMGVSKGLVSLALSNKYGVSEDTRSKIVLRAIELGYDFSIVQERGRTLLFTIIIDDFQMIKEVFWSKIVSGIEKSMTTNRVAINILIWNKTAHYEDIITNILDSKTKSVIVINKCNDTMLKLLSTLKIPVVLIDIMQHMSLQYDHVLSDNYGGGFEAAKHLSDYGHNHIAFVGYIDYAVSFQERWQGFK